MKTNGTQPVGGGVAKAATLASAADPETSPEDEHDNGPADVNGPTDAEGRETSPEDENGPTEKAPTRQRRRGRKQADAPKAPTLDDAKLMALGKLTIAAAQQGVGIDEYAETHLVPLAEAYAAWKAVRSA
jgi:hypothetical protein